MWNYCKWEIEHYSESQIMTPTFFNIRFRVNNYSTIVAFNYFRENLVETQ